MLAAAELAEGQVREVEAGGRLVAVTRVEGKVHALDGRCPHRDGPLGRGDLQGHFLYCPLHAWAFDVRSGEAFFPRGARVPCVPVREREGQIELGLP